MLVEADSPFRIMSVNQAWTDLCGFTESEAISCTPKLLQGPCTDTQKTARHVDELKNHGQASMTILNYAKGGRAFAHQVKSRRVVDERDGATYFITESSEASGAVRRAVMRQFLNTSSHLTGSISPNDSNVTQRNVATSVLALALALLATALVSMAQEPLELLPTHSSKTVETAAHAVQSEAHCSSSSELMPMLVCVAAALVVGTFAELQTQTRSNGPASTSFKESLAALFLTLATATAALSVVWQADASSHLLLLAAFFAAAALDVASSVSSSSSPLNSILLVLGGSVFVMAFVTVAILQPVDSPSWETPPSPSVTSSSPAPPFPRAPPTEGGYPPGYFLHLVYDPSSFSTMFF